MYAQSITPTPRRPIINNPENPLSDWLSGALTVTHPDGRLRRAQTLVRYAWCVALLGYDKETIVAALQERDAQPAYQKYTERRDKGLGTYRGMARAALRSHARWQRRQAQEQSEELAV